MKRFNSPILIFGVLFLLIEVFPVSIAFSVDKVIQKLKTNQIVNATDGSAAPGTVPIGGMVAVMPSTHANAWQPPASGAIKDGFMRADGATISAQNVTDGSLFPAGTVLPNMVGNFPKGGATSGTVTGAQKLIAGASGHLPPLTPTGTNSGGSVTGSNSGGSVTGSNSASSVSGTVGGSDGTHGHTATTYQGVNAGGNSTWQLAGAVSGAATIPATGSGHGHSFSLTAGAQTWTQGTFTNPTWTQGTFTNPIFTGNNLGATNTTTQTVLPDPANVTVVWIIRVK